MSVTRTQKMILEEFSLRFLFSTNHKDIGILYILFAGFAGIIGTLMSVFIRLELGVPGTTILNENYQLYNVMITAHAIIMIFFLVMPALLGALVIIWYLS